MTVFFRLTGIILILAIWLGSLMPLNNVVLPGSDKLHHFAAYGGLMLIWVLATPHLNLRRQALMACVFMLMGLTIEVAQGFTPYRFFEWADALANAVGVLIGWTFGQLALRIQTALSLKRTVTAL